MKKYYPLMFLIILIISLSTVMAVRPSISNTRIKPNSTTLASEFFQLWTPNITYYYTYSDGMLNIIQDYNYTIYRNKVVNLTLPRPIARFSFDYDNYSAVYDRSLVDASNDGNYHGTSGRMFEKNVIGYYGFEEIRGSLARDWSPYKNNASMPPSTTARINYTDCKKGACLTLRGTSQAMLNITNRTYGTFKYHRNVSNLSISTWVNLRNMRDGELFNKERIGYAYFQVAFINSSQELNRFKVWTYRGYSGDDSTIRTQYVTLTPGWHHLVVTYQTDSTGGKFKAFWDNTAMPYVLNQSSSGTIEDDQKGAWHIGNQPNILSNAPFNGSIDEFYIFNKTLNAKEIAELYQDSAKFGYAYYFRNNTNEYINIANSALWNKWTNMTICLWMKPTFYQPGATPIKVFNKGWAGNGAWAVTIANDGETRFAMTDSLGNTFTATWFGSAYQNRWTHVCGVHNQTDALLYINGTMSSVQAKLSGTGFNANTGAIEIGNTGITHYRGMIDDIVIWNKSLNNRQIQSVYKNSIYLYTPKNGTYHVNLSHYNFTTTDPRIRSSYTYIINLTEATKSLGLQYCYTGIVTLGIRCHSENIPSFKYNTAIEIYGTTWYNEPYTGQVNYKNFSINRTGKSNYTLCLFTNKTLYSNVYIKQTNPTGFTHRYYFVNHTFNDKVQNVTLYNFNDTTGMSDFYGVVRHASDYSIYKNIVVTLQRFYTGTGIWRNVQMDESDDFGTIFFNIMEQTVDYRLIFMDRYTKQILKTTDNLKFVCDAGVCTFDIPISNASIGSTSANIVADIDYDATTKLVNVSWLDTSGATQSINVKVVKRFFHMTSTVCDRTQVGNGGWLNCSVAGEEGDVSVIVTSTYDDAAIASESVHVNETGFQDLIKKQGLRSDVNFMSLGLVLTITIGGLVFNPIAGLMLMLGSIIILSFAGLLSMVDTTIIILLASLIVIVVVSVKRMF